MPITMLTPIKVPGKNTRDQRRAVVAASRSKKIARPIGRPPKLAVSSDSYRALILGSRRSQKLGLHRPLKNLKTKRKMATLEKLPTELLLKVFFFSMNLDLPRASPIVAGKLSSKYTYIQTILAVLGPTWHDCYTQLISGCTAQIKKPTHGDSALQSSMLRCRWASVSLLRRAADIWIRRATGEQASNHLVSTQEGDQVSLRWQLMSEDERFVEEYNEFLALTGRLGGDGDKDVITSNWSWSRLLEVHPEVDIPESLLRGPWTEDMVMHLFWLVRAGARIQGINSTSWEVAIPGLNTAIATGNLQVLCIFQYLGLGAHVTLDILKWTTRHAGGRKLEVNTCVMGMFMAQRLKSGASRSMHNELVSFNMELARMEVMARQECEGREDETEAISWVKALKSRWAHITNSSM